MSPKIVPFFPNVDQRRCQQACVKSVLKYFLPDREFSDAEIDEGTAQLGGTTWFPPAVMFLDQAGLSVQLHTSAKMDYREFALRGTEYIRDNGTEEDFQIQEKNGAFLAIGAVQEAAKKMLDRRIVKPEQIDIKELSKILENPEVLAIGKTFRPWLSGIYENRYAHYVVIIKSYNSTLWRIHDPGPPSIENRKVNKKTPEQPMFSEVLVIAEKK